MYFTNWGLCNFTSDYSSALLHKENSKFIYNISIFDNYTNVEMKLNNKILLTFTDNIIDVNNLSTFSRTIKDQDYIFKNGELLLKRIVRKCSYLKAIEPSTFLNNQIITMDLETRSIGGIMEAYCVSIYDGNNITSFYLTDYKD